MAKNKQEIASRAIDKVFARLHQDEQASAYLSSSRPVDANVKAAIDQEIQKEIALETKYGDSPIEAGVGSALSAATLGLSDQLLVAGGVSPERLSETRERSSVAAGTGTVAGIVGPAIGSGGTSLVAKGVKAVATPLEAAATLGKIATRGAERIVEGRVRSAALKEILKSAAGNAAEGAAYGLGNFVSEEALGRADLNAQNVVAATGAGALLGVGFGAGIGGAKAAMPVLKKGIQPIAEKLYGASKDILDPKKAAAELVGITPVKMSKIQEFRPAFADELPEFLINKLNLKPLTTADELITTNSALQQSAGNTIKNTVKSLDDYAIINPDIMPPRADIYARLQAKLEPFEAKAMASPKVFKAELEALKSFRDDLQTLANKGNPNLQPIGKYMPQSSLKELDNLRKTYQGIKYKGGGATESFRANVAEKLRQELRGIVDETASAISSRSMDPSVQRLAADLKTANHDFYTASLLEKYLPKKLNGKALLGLQDVVEGSVIGAATGSGPVGAAVALGRRLGKSDLRRKAVILSDIKSHAMKFESAIKSAVGGFVRKAGKPLKQLSAQSLLNSGFAVDYENAPKAPKNRKEAFKNVAANLGRLQEDQDVMLEQLARSTARIGQVAPNIAQETQNTLVRSVQFLQSKVPKSPSQASMFAREYEPSSLELAKFERYMQAVEHPMSVLEDLEAGTLTREHVEALQVVYPAIYEQLRQEALEQAVTEDSKLSYNRKLQLGILLNVPTDPSLVPQNIAGLQTNFMPQNDPMQVEAQQGAVRGGSQAAMTNINVASRAEGSVESVANRKQGT